MPDAICLTPDCTFKAKHQDIETAKRIVLAHMQADDVASVAIACACATLEDNAPLLQVDEEVVEEFDAPHPKTGDTVKRTARKQRKSCTRCGSKYEHTEVDPLDAG